MHYREFRHPSNFTVQIKTLVGQQTAKLIDVNTGGARLSGQIQLTAGETISIKVLNHTIAGHVRWVGGGRAGLSFRPEISLDVVDKIRQCMETRHFQQRYDSSHLQEMR